MYRKKSSDGQVLRIFMHRDSYEVCPIHVIGSMIITRSSVAMSEHIFSDIIKKKNIADHVNVVLTNVYNKAVDQSKTNSNKVVPFAKYTSHSLRHGSAETASEHPEISIQDVALRGNWILNTKCKVFFYLAGTARTDSRVGRVLSGWTSSEHGGFSPMVDCFSSSDTVEHFYAYTSLLFSYFINASDAIDDEESSERNNVAVHLCLVLLYHFEEVYNTFGTKHIVNIKMLSVFDQMSQYKDFNVEHRVALLMELCKEVKNFFILFNKIIMPSKDGEISEEHARISKLEEGVNQVYTNITEVKQSINKMVSTMESLILKCINSSIPALVSQSIESYLGKRKLIVANDESTEDDTQEEMNTNPKKKKQLKQQQLTSLIQVSSTSAVTTTNKISICLIPYETKGVKIHDVFYNWFVSKLFNVEFTNYEEKQINECKSNFTKYTKLIFFMKVFIVKQKKITPQNPLIISECPPLENTLQHKAWMTNILHLAKAATVACNQFRFEYSKNQGGKRVKLDTESPSFKATIQLMTKLSQQDFEKYNLVSDIKELVIDKVTCSRLNITSLEMLKATNYHH
jgi:hypothetical protein